LSIGGIDLNYPLGTLQCGYIKMDWAKKLLEYAPDIAGAILSGGTTLPALAIKAFKDATGEDVTSEADVAEVMKNITPEQKIKLTNANNTFKIEMKRLGNELTYAELADTQQARETHSHSKMPALIVSVLTIMVFVLTVLLVFHPVPVANEAVFYMLIGQIVAAWMASIAYWVGTTRSSAQKTIQSSLNKAKGS
jgi:uncharacterized membrane protein (DUF485 family)